MNDIASQPVMSMYSTDPGTGLTIISPRVYRLRQLQACEGMNLAELRLEQRGLAPITYMHHVSKIIEGNTESYRVRICRTCSGLPTLLELGSYTDVESALLVNDVHELMQDRTKQLHLLCVDDVKYFNSIAVRRRGSPHDLQITSVLQERLWKKSSAASATAKKLLKEITNNEIETVAVAAATANSNALKSDQYLDTLDFFETTSFPTGYKGRISSESAGVYPDIINKNERTHMNQNGEGVMEKTKLQYPAKDMRNPFQVSSILSNKDMTDNSLVRMSSRNSADETTLNSETSEASLGGHGQGHGLAQDVLSSDSFTTTGQYQDQGIPKVSSNVFEAFNDEEESPSSAASTATATSYVASSFPSESQEGKQSAIPTTGEQGRVGIINRPSSQALSRAGRIVDQFKANLVRYHATFIQWNFFDNPADIDRMFLALADFVGAELTHVISSASMRRNGSRGGGSADSAQAVAVAETNVREAWKVGRAPRSSLLSTIASVFPGNSMEMQMICKRVASIIAQDTPSVSRFNDLYAQAVDEIQKIENDIRAYDFHPYFPASSTDFDTGNEEVAGSVKPVSDDGETSPSGSAPLSMPPLSFCFKDCEEFIR
jgi:hypothetical protein